MWKYVNIKSICVESLFISPVLDINWQSDMVVKDRQHPSSPLSKELQQHPWPAGYKACILTFNEKTNPRKFIAAYETTVFCS